MDYSLATEQQLITIALYEDCSLDDKYAACYELELRKPYKAELKDIIRLSANYKPAEIAYRLCADLDHVIQEVERYALEV